MRPGLRSPIATVQVIVACACHLSLPGLSTLWPQRRRARRRSRSRCGVSEGDPEADADQLDYGPKVDLVSVEEAHHKSHDHNDDRGNSKSASISCTRLKAFGFRLWYTRIRL